MKDMISDFGEGLILIILIKLEHIFILIFLHCKGESLGDVFLYILCEKETVHYEKCL